MQAVPANPADPVWGLPFLNDRRWHKAGRSPSKTEGKKQHAPSGFPLTNLIHRTGSLPAILTTAKVSLLTAAAALSTFPSLGRTRLIHHQSTAHERSAVASLDGLVRQGIIVDFNESKPARLATKPVAKDVDRVNTDTSLLEERLYIRFGRFIRQVPHE